MRSMIFFIAACALAAITPILPCKSVHRRNKDMLSQPRWPTHFQGKVLTRLPLAEGDKIFENGFPGRIARFSDGQREIVYKWLKKPTRRLHPVSDCFKGMGFEVKPMPVRVDGNDNRWGCFRAVKDNEMIYVTERIYDESGNSWTEVSSWYWAAFLGKTHSPWWSVTVSDEKVKTKCKE
ncbi:MAG: hypothetical protein ACMUJM_13760 [bacterium]